MTMWIYNPPEPLGNPTQPGPWDAPNQVTGFDFTDLFTRGHCGTCAACPKVWRMEVPYIVGSPWASTYAGVFYLQRTPYIYQGVNTGYFQSKCSWSTNPSPPFPDRNPNNGVTSEGWHMTFELNIAENAYRWSLYSPIEDANVLGDPAQSIWICRDIFRCLHPNTFQLAGSVGTYGFPYAPEFLTLVPHPA